MQITLTNAGKRFNREWIFRHFNQTFIAGNTYAITGSNGSGKSTLLQVIAGAIMQSEGKVTFHHYSATEGNHNPIEINEESYKGIVIAAPYIELIEEMTAVEFLDFHSTFKNLSKPVAEILKEVGLEKAAAKQIRYFSSGMKQRLKLAQAFFSDASVLLLDEPTTSLDTEGIELYRQLINNYSSKKLVIVSSNDKQEYDFCNEIISIEKYK